MNLFCILIITPNEIFHSGLCALNSLEWNKAKRGQSWRNKNQRITKRIRAKKNNNHFDHQFFNPWHGQMRFECAAKREKWWKYLYIYAWNVYIFMNLKETCRRHIFTFVTRQMKGRNTESGKQHANIHKYKSKEKKEKFDTRQQQNI